jgi:hypothetical protein
MNIKDIVESLFLLFDFLFERSWIERKASVDRSRRCIQVEHDGGITQPVDTSQRPQCLIDNEQRTKDRSMRYDQA